MAEAAHRIHRQVFELTVSSTEAATQIQERVARLRSSGLSKDLNKMFDATAAAAADATAQTARNQAPLRIECLTVDLGTLASDGLEAELRNALKRELPKSLERALAEQGAARDLGKDDQSDPLATHSSLTLIEQLLTSAQLPWWADPDQRSHLERAVSEFLGSPADATKTRLRQLLLDPVAAYRAARHLSPRVLEQLVDQLSPGRGRDARAILSGLARGLPTQRRRPQCAALWAAILQTAADGNPPRRAFWREVFARLAENNQLGLREQLASLPASGAAAELLEALQSELPEQDSSQPTKIDERLTQLSTQWPAVSDLLEWLRDTLRRQPQQTSAALGTEITSFCTALEQSRAAAVIPAVRSLLRKLRHVNLTPSATLTRALHRWAKQVEQEDAAQINPKALSVLVQKLEPNADRAIVRIQTDNRTLCEEGLPVINAGLVLLWPFLKTFFTRLELLEGESFRDPAAQDDAVSLLHYLSTGDLDPPEYQLPLNKLLCGLDPSAPWQPEQRLDNEALAECDDLLDALIARAPNLGKLSHDGLRGSFLLRRGLLRAESDGWLLRVERESYDVLLDRLPWPINWIRLPWMPAPLQVEW